MLSKRSTHVDQILGSESIPSKLSVAIFVASRTLLGTQECLIYQKKSKKGTTRADPLYWLVDCAIYIAQSGKVNKSDSCVYSFLLFFYI